MKQLDREMGEETDIDKALGDFMELYHKENLEKLKEISILPEAQSSDLHRQYPQIYTPEEKKKLQRGK